MLLVLSAARVAAAARSIDRANSPSVGKGAPYSWSRSRRMAAKGLSEVVSSVCSGGSPSPSLERSDALSALMVQHNEVGAVAAVPRRQHGLPLSPCAGVWRAAQAFSLG